jgi:N-methylhydantoinase A
VTDADAVLGLLNPRNFAGGSFDLDIEAARESLREHVAAPLDMAVEAAAVSVRDIVDSKLASAVRVVSVKKGNDPREFSLVGYGGAGPMHACDVAAELGVDEVLFPRDPGIMSAFGLTVSDITHNYVRSVVEAVGALDVDGVNAVIMELLERGADELDAEGLPAAKQRFGVAFEMMYAGQAHQLTVPLVEGLDRGALDGAVLDGEQLEAVVDRFEAEHDRRFGFVDDHADVRVTNVRVTAVGEVDRPAVAASSGSGSVADARLETRDVVRDVDDVVSVPCYEWEVLPSDATIEGPAIAELSNTTLWLPPDWDGRLDADRNLIARRRT